MVGGQFWLYDLSGKSFTRRVRRTHGEAAAIFIITIVVVIVVMMIDWAHQRFESLAHKRLGASIHYALLDKDKGHHWSMEAAFVVLGECFGDTGVQEER